MSGQSERPLKVGLVLPVGGEWMAGETALWNDMKAMALHAEAVGFDSIWVNDHLLYQFGEPGEPRRGNWECWSLVSALAAITSRIEIGTLVACTGFRNPALLAKTVDAVDGISGGRLILGVGAGNHESDYTAFGYPFDHRVGRFEEAIKVIHTLLRQGEIDFQGQYYQARDCEILPRLSSRNGPPILMGPRVNSSRMLRLMAAYADYWTVFNVNSLETYLPMRDAVDAACIKAGRDPATLARTLTMAIDLPGFDADVDPPSWVWRFRRTRLRAPFSGSVKNMTEHLRSFAQAGLSHIPVWLDPLSMAGIDAFAPVLEGLNRG
jgi:alkanesulfonate monooxygenase SsuD/methylene tetrahydromethanopterin reductase-like flavin-dependent oxidoreductase (luciferase family)